MLSFHEGLLPMDLQLGGQELALKINNFNLSHGDMLPVCLARASMAHTENSSYGIRTLAQEGWGV